MNAASDPVGPTGADPTETPPLADVLSEQADQGYAHAAPEDVVGAITEMVAHPEYPCLGARSVFRRDRARIVVLDDMRSRDCVAALSAELRTFGADVDPEDDFASLIATFRAPVPESEEEFEGCLWSVLQTLADIDRQEWAEGVSSDPQNPHFSFSHAGTAFFVVGLHPLASRVARRAPLPALVFNLHAQFEALRESGRFDGMRDTIRRRDEALNGTVNPMVDDYGDSSEARQYSGRAVGPDWTAPLDPHTEETSP